MTESSHPSISGERKKYRRHSGTSYYAKYIESYLARTIRNHCALSETRHYLPNSFTCPATAGHEGSFSRHALNHHSCTPGVTLKVNRNIGAAPYAKLRRRIERQRLREKQGLHRCLSRPLLYLSLFFSHQLMRCIGPPHRSAHAPIKPDHTYSYAYAYIFSLSLSLFLFHTPSRGITE